MVSLWSCYAIMYSNRSEHSHGRQYSDRNSRQWDNYEDRRERRDSHRDALRDSHHKYGGDGLNSTERTSRSREYSDSPTRLYSKDSLKRDWSGKSPVRRRLSPDWASSENKRQRFTEDDEEDYRYRRAPEDKISRQSPDSFSRVHGSKDFKCGPPQEEDFSCRKATQDSRHRYRQEEFTYRQQHDDLSGRRSSGYYKDRDGQERSWDRSPDRKRSQEHSKGYVKARMRNNSPYRDHQNRSRFPMNASTGQSSESSVAHHSATVPEQKSTKGFQRFLDVLNKGVNVDTLTKIVNQTTTKADNRSPSPTSFTNAADRRWSPISAEKIQGSHHNTRHWSESDGSKRLSSPQPQHKSYSPVGRFLSDEKSHHRDDGKQSCFSSSSRSGSPSVVEKITLTTEEEHKHKQMQDVLQAIGLNLGFEELGQMSHRIQERLYGKKDGDVGHHGRGSGEREARRAYSPRHNRSSSSRSSFSPSPRDYYMRKDSDSAQRDVTEAHRVQAHQAIEYVQNSSNSILQESETSETNSHECPAAFSENPAYTFREQSNSQKSPAACQAFPENPTYTFSEPPPAAVMPMYSPVNCSPLPYPGLPPSLPHVRPGLLLPRLPPFLPYPRVPPLNIFPAMLAQRQLLPQHLSNPPLLTLPIQPLNTTQKSKPLSRPRCLQVIETKQPG